MSYRRELEGDCERTGLLRASRPRRGLLRRPRGSRAIASRVVPAAVRGRLADAGLGRGARESPEAAHAHPNRRSVELLSPLWEVCQVNSGFHTARICADCDPPVRRSLSPRATDSSLSTVRPGRGSARLARIWTRSIDGPLARRVISRHGVPGRTATRRVLGRARAAAAGIAPGGGSGRGRRILAESPSAPRPSACPGTTTTFPRRVTLRPVGCFTLRARVRGRREADQKRLVCHGRPVRHLLASAVRRVQGRAAPRRGREEAEEAECLMEQIDDKLHRDPLAARAGPTGLRKEPHVTRARRGTSQRRSAPPSMPAASPSTSTSPGAYTSLAISARDMCIAASSSVKEALDQQLKETNGPMETLEHPGRARSRPRRHPSRSARGFVRER